MTYSSPAERDERTIAALSSLARKCQLRLNVSLPIVGVELQYPRCEDGRPTAVEINLCDVRAADGLLISYDFDRDGWVVKQASRFEWEAGDTVCDPGWKEVAFVQAWGSKIE
jgi:hypothetical protein